MLEWFSSSNSQRLIIIYIIFKERLINRDTFILKSEEQSTKVLVIENKTAIIFLRELFNVIKKSYETLKQDITVDNVPGNPDPSTGFSLTISNVKTEH